MVGRQTAYAKIIVGTCIALCVCLQACGASKGAAHPRAKRHFLAWESANAKDKMRPWRSQKRPEREYEVRARRAVRLEKPSFWDLKPVQFSTPVSDGEKVYVGSNAGMFYAIDLEPNAKQWWVKTEGGIESKAALGEDAVYVGDIKGYAYSFDTKDGSINWKVPLGNELLGAPLVVGRTVYITTLDGRLFALDATTGMEFWHTDAMERLVGFTVRGQSSPIFYNGKIIFGTSRGTLVSYTTDGTLDWVRLLGNPRSQVMDVDSKPLIIGDKLYAASADGMLYCLDPMIGEILWGVPAGGANDLLYHNDVLYASGAGVLTALDPATGSKFWEQNLDTPGISSPAGGKGYIAVVSTRDKLYLVDQYNGDIVFERYIRKGSFGDPLVLNDELFVVANTARVFSFIIHEKEKKVKKKKDESVASSE
jgi:outer membrane protein assembly factor BamB